MDLTKAQRLLHKIQAFLDNGNGQELSRLEKDLIKSYIVQLYDAVVSDDNSSVEHHKPAEMHEVKKHREEPVMKSEPVRVSEFPKSEPLKTHEQKTEHTPAARQEYTPPQQEKIIEKEKTPVESKWSSPPPEIKHVQEREPEKVTPSAPKHHMTDEDALQKLFEVQKGDDLSHRFGHVPIPSIESAMGLNERIFTLNELFGGDKALFDATCHRLNNLSSFAEAKNVLMNGPARDFKWAEPKRIKMAEQFLRIVARKYPKPVA